MALRLADVDLDAAAAERSLEETNEGLRFKAPKTKHGKRTISLPAMALGLGKPNSDTLLFAEVDGLPRRPDQLAVGLQVAQAPDGVVPCHATHPCVSANCRPGRCRGN